MLTKSLVAVILSFPASVAVIGVLLTATSSLPELLLPSLLMVFPLWVCAACASFLFAKPGTAAAVLIAITVAGFGLINVLKL